VISPANQKRCFIAVHPARTLRTLPARAAFRSGHLQRGLGFAIARPRETLSLNSDLKLHMQLQISFAIPPPAAAEGFGYQPP
jgi:hypothetical protein